MRGFRRTRLQDRQATGVRAPADDTNGHRACAPAVHLRFTRFVEIYRARAHHSSTIVVNDIKTGLTRDLKKGAYGADRPVCRSAAYLAMLQVGASRRAQTILQVGRLRVRVGGSADA